MRTSNLIYSPKSLVQQLVPAFSAGLVISVIEIFVEVSFAAMLFSGGFSEFLGLGIGLCLAGTFIHSLFSVLTSSSRNTISVVQDAPIAIMAVVLGSIATQMDASTPEEKLATGLAVIIFSSLLAALFFWMLGRFSLGRLVRFIPYPVVGGFLAGTGFLLVTGGIGVMANAPFDIVLLQSDLLLRWLPGFVYGVILLFVLRRFSQFWLMSVLLVVGLILFYTIYFLFGGTLASASANGWLLGPFPDGQLWQSVTFLAFTQANWSMIFENAVQLSAVLLIGSISLLFNVSGLEVISHEDVDLNRELKWSGIANFVGALVVSPIGYTALAFSALGYRLGGRTRFIGLSTTLIIGLTLLFGAATLANFPRMIAGGLLVFVGLSFLMEWLVDSWVKLPRLDYLLIWVILVVIVGIGILQGVTIGILIAALLFLYNYSQTNVIRYATTRADYVSTTVRPPLYEQLLEKRGKNMVIVTLQGYIFFGTAHRLVEQIVARIENPGLSPLRFLVLDFRLVTDIDASAAFSFERLKQSTDINGVQVVLTSLDPALESRLADGVLSATSVDESHRWRVMPTQAAGVAWCDQQIIDTFADVGLRAAPKSVIDEVKEHFPHVVENIDWIDYLRPGSQPSLSTEFTIFLGYLNQIRFCSGDTLMKQGTTIDGLYFLEEGKATYTTAGNGEATADSGYLDPGTFFGIDTFYSGQPASCTITATSDGMLYYLSCDDLQRMEADNPKLAMVLHRQLAARFSKIASRTEELARALQH